MKRYYVITNWKKNNPKSMLEVSSLVGENMTNNDHFPEPPITMDVLETKTGRLQSAYNNRRNGRLAKIELQDASADMDDVLRIQAMYVTQTAGGDNAIIETSGYTVNKGDATKATLPDMPTNVKLESSNGNALLIAKKPAGAASLCWIVYYGDVTVTMKVENNQLIVPMGVSAQIITPAGARELVKSLTPGTKVSAQVLAQNSAGKSALTDLVSVYVNK